MYEKITLQWQEWKHITQIHPRIQRKIAKLTRRQPVYHQEKVVANQLATLYQITFVFKY